MSAYNCPFKITDGIDKEDKGDHQDENKKTTSVLIEISRDLKIKQSVTVINQINDPYEVLIF